MIAFLIWETGKNRGLKREAELILLYYVPHEPLSRWIPPWAPKQKQSSLAPGFSWSPQPALGELYYGAYRSGRLETSLAQIERFLDAVDLLVADKETSVFYGQIAAGLARAGTPIPQNDIWIAALARQTGLPVATTDDHFDRVTNLAVLKW